MKSLVFIFLLAVRCGLAVGLTREYIFNSDSKWWNRARRYCQRHYKDLATITTMEENSQLFQSGPDNTESWIGLNKKSGTWEWSDGERASFLRWYRGSPYYQSDGYDCARTSEQVPDFWFNSECDKQKSFYCYRFLILVKENKTWEEAREYCRTNYTGLASVTSETSLRQLELETVQTQTESVWTGLSFVNGLWLWVSEEQLGSLVSMPSCPVPSYHCGALNNMTRTLENLNCNERLNFVCYWQ